MRLLGTLTRGDQVSEVVADTKRVSRYLANSDGYLVKLSLYCDGLGSGVGDQVLRGVVYLATGELLGQGDPVTITDGQEAGWVDLTFHQYKGGIFLVNGLKYDLGYLAGPVSNSARVYGRASVGV
jgi:hypothetical protein